MNAILNIDFQNCYGIRKLKKDFKFTEKEKTFSIYASNGSMKTSFAKTFYDISKGKSPKDLIFPDRETICDIKLNDEVIEPSQIFVIRSYLEKYEFEKISTLLANKELREEYENISKEINSEKDNLLKGLKKVCKITKLEDIEKIISNVFYKNDNNDNNDNNNFFESLEIIEGEVNGDEVAEYKDVEYKNVLDDKVKKFLNTANVKNNIEDYIHQYDKLLDDSTYFKKGIFNHSQAEDTAKQLKSNGFFKAEHAVLFGGEKLSTEQELQVVIQQEKDKILKNEKLKKAFDGLDTKLTKNQDLKDFRNCLSNNNFIIAELQDLESFEEKLWKYYIKENLAAFNTLLEVYKKGKEDIQNISQQAQDEETKWVNAIDIFNERFLVPFKVTIGNKVDVILKETRPSINFEFVEGDERKTVEKDFLLEVLSQGEKRALYLLDIIFEIEARKIESNKCLFIIDDIADSFDYKNKYAIIEYLRDISKEGKFYQIVLSHNFDFHRTISSRLSMQRKNKMVAKKNNNEIILEEETYQKNIFTDWRENLDDKYKLIASIALVRNLAEYIGDEETEKELTKYLHIKEGFDGLTISNLKCSFNKILKGGSKKISSEDTFSNFLQEAVGSINGNIELEHKITLAISIRLNAEQFMISKIDDSSFVSEIGSNQTAGLIDKYKKEFPTETQNIKILDKVQLMTPESIHLNSFMFEPLLDMSHEYLTDLHREIKELSTI